MLEELLRYLKNWFVKEKHCGTFSVPCEFDFLQEGQYFRIVGSVFNDGVYTYPEPELREETFDGEIWALAIPKAVITLAQEISDWNDQYGAAVLSPYSSESFGGYSYSRSDSGVEGGGAADWRTVFRIRLNRWRKI